jgi:LuxR family maltose regulon positive regulatory protein
VARADRSTWLFHSLRARSSSCDLHSLLTMEEIAAQHMVSVNTVKTHLRSLYRKLEAPNRREVAAAARRLGLL